MLKLKKDADITNFLLSVKSCDGDVFYESTEGDILNLASTLSQYVFCSVASQPRFLENGVIRCDHPEDVRILEAYLEES